MPLPSTSVEFEMIVEEQSAFDTESDRSTEEVIKNQLRERHLSMLILSVLILAISLALSVSGLGEEEAVAWGEIELPQLCGSRAWFGVECPGCGLTRSFIALATGDFSESVRYHRVGWVLWLAVILQIPFRGYSLWKMQTSVLERRWPTWFGSFLIATLIGNWILKVLLQ